MTWMPQFVMFWDPAPTVVSIFVYFLVFKFLYYVSHTLAVVPYYALGAELSTDYQERTRIVAWRHIRGYIQNFDQRLTYRDPQRVDTKCGGIEEKQVFPDQIFY